MVGLAEAMSRTGSSHDGLIRAIVGRADLTDDGAGSTAPAVLISAAQLLQLAKALAGQHVSIWVEAIEPKTKPQTLTQTCVA